MATEQNAEDISILREAGRTYVSLQSEETEVISKVVSDHALSDGAQSECESCSKSDDLSMDDLDSKISLACSDAKEKINEIFNLKSTFFEYCDTIIKTEQRKFIEELNKNSEELRRIKHLAESYQSTVHFKDDIISNLVEMLQKEKEKFASCKAFYTWRVQCLDAKREKFYSAVAAKHYEEQLKKRVFRAWRTAVEMGWKERIEYNTRLQMQEQQQHILTDYELRIKSMEEELKESKEKIDSLQSNHKAYEDMMKQALMRGVCALNVEAMSVLCNSSEMSSEPSATSLCGPHISGHPADRLNIPSDLSSIHPCPACLWCPSEIAGEKPTKCIGLRKNALFEPPAPSKPTPVHHSSTLKCLPMMGTANVPAQAPKARNKYPDSAFCYGPNISVQRHIDKSTSSLSGGLRSSTSRDQLRRS